MNTQDLSPSALARRLVKMGFFRTIHEFLLSGVSLVQLVLWWYLWPRDPRRNLLDNLGASVYPAVACGIANFRPVASPAQAVFAAMLPLQKPETALAQWTEWAIASKLDKTYPGPAPVLAVLEYLLKNRPDVDKVHTWSRILDCVFDREGGIRHVPDDQGIALLETVGRSGLRALAPLVSGVLHTRDEEMLLAAIACLARLGVPDAELPAELLLNSIHPEVMELARCALGFVETGDVDLLSVLLNAPNWLERVQALRLVEAVLVRRGVDDRLKKDPKDSLIDLLLAQLEEEHDCDVVRCLAVTLGLALRRGGEAQLAKAFETSAKLTLKDRFESLLDALLIAELPASAAPQVEELRKQAANMDVQALRALNRVLMSIGEPSGTVRDWLEVPVVVYLQMGVLRLPEPVRVWFESPGECSEAAVAAWLTERPASALTIAFCAAYLAARPGFLKVLERVWIDAADDRKSETLNTVGALLAGAAEDCSISPAELRCCLGHKIGGPLEESPEMLGQLLGLLMTQNKQIRRSAGKLLMLTSPYGRVVAGSCLRSLKRNSSAFEKCRSLASHFGVSAPPLNHPGTLPLHLQPLFADIPPVNCPPERLLEALTLPDNASKTWARGCIDWEKPESVKGVFDGTDFTALACSFLQASSCANAEARRLAGLLVAGIGPRLIESSHRDRIVQRVIFLAAHDPDANVRPAGRKAAEALGIADRVPNTPTPAPTPANSSPSSQPDSLDSALEELLRNEESSFAA